jgi:hypothetical protein
MPDMHVSLQQINGAFAATSVNSLDATPFGPGNDLVDALDALPGVQLTAAARAFIASWPSGLKAAVTAAVFDDLSRPVGTRVPILLSWTPGYDFEVRMWDVRNTTSTHGELTIHLTSRYPGDPHPLV